MFQVKTKFITVLHPTKAGQIHSRFGETEENVWRRGDV